MFDSAFQSPPPPANLAAEHAVLGACLANNKLLDSCGPLQPQHFMGEGLGDIFKAIRDGIAEGRHVDAVSLRTRFDPGTLAALLAAYPSFNVVPEYARVIVDLAKARQLLEVAQAIQADIYADKSPNGVASEAIAKMDRLCQGKDVERSVTLDSAIDAVFQDLWNPERMAGISSGFRCMDQRLGGLEPGLVYVIGGRPGMGKSSIASQMCLSAARSGIGVLELSLEMSAAQLARRALSTASGIPIMTIKRGNLSVRDTDRLSAARKELRGLPLMIDDAGGQTPSMIAAKAREARRRHGLGLLMIDHLNLMRAEAEDAKHGGTWAVGRASNAVLSIAKDCGVPVILCVQLNRGVEAREDKRPTLADLRQAGDIEQDAYAVGFVYRPEYYIRGEPERREGEGAGKFEERVSAWHDARERSAGMGELIWAKVRDGETGIDSFRFNGPTATFSELPV